MKIYGKKNKGQISIFFLIMFLLLIYIFSIFSYNSIKFYNNSNKIIMKTTKSLQNYYNNLDKLIDGGVISSTFFDGGIINEHYK